VGASGALGHGRVMHEAGEVTSFFADTDIEHPTPLVVTHDFLSYPHGRACNMDGSGF
jgi:hypothetical protein